MVGNNRGVGQDLHKRAVVCLNALAEQLDPVRDEILFVDCGSPDDVPTFPEAVRDLLRPRVRSMTRVLRLREGQLKASGWTGSPTWLDALSRNAALRRAKSSSRWILNIGSDVVLSSKSDKSVSRIACELEDGFYRLGWISVPKSVWGDLDRRNGSAAIERLASWREAFGPNGNLEGDPVEGLLLALRGDLLTRGGFAESSDEGATLELVSRLSRGRGSPGSLSGFLEMFHLEHEVDADRIQEIQAMEGEEEAKSDIPTIQHTWGFAGEAIEEVRLDGSGPFLGALRAIVPPDPSAVLLPPADGSADFGTDIPLTRLLPFLADHFADIPGSWPVAVVGSDAFLVASIICLRKGLNHSGSVLCHGMAPVPGAETCTVDEISSKARLVVFDPGTRDRRASREPLAEAMIRISLAHSAKSSSERPKVIVLVPHFSWAGVFAQGLFDLNLAPTDTWIYHGRAKDRIDADRMGTLRRWDGAGHRMDQLLSRCFRGLLGLGASCRRGLGSMGPAKSRKSRGSDEGGMSVVVYGRNDGYGQNLQKRAVASLNALAEQLDPGRDEILFTDCNSPEEGPTFPEAAQDILGSRTRSLLRVFRLRPDQFASHRRGGSGPVLEAISRNVAIRRASPSSRWILSTNTDVVLVSRSGRKLTEIVSNLEDGFYGLPRHDLPQALWGVLDRMDGIGTMERVASWADEFGLRAEVRHYRDFVGWDNPGDFQLALRADLLSMGGFDESMCDGPYHVDSNLGKRISLVRGAVQRLEGMELFHLDHSRQAMRRLTEHARGNDWRKKVLDVRQPDISSVQPGWGVSGEMVEEIRLDSSRCGEGSLLGWKSEVGA